MNQPADSDLGRMERLASTILRVGILLGGVLIIIGVALLAYTDQTGYGAIPPHDLAALLRFGAPGTPGAFPTTPGQVMRDALGGKPYAIIELGLLALIATPAMRVALSMALFAAERDWLYMVVTLLVLSILITSYLLGASVG